MKLVIQIPCHNEAKVLPTTIQDLPRQIDGISEIEILVIDDGSTDNTVAVAQEHGVHHIVKNTQNLGLAKTFRKGLNHAIDLSADIIVNTDGDNQYVGEDIVSLVAPLLRGEADIAIGARPIKDHEEFSKYKKLLQRFGSFVVRTVSGTDVADAPSGFRAFTRQAAKQINVFSEYTYTLETIIQGGVRGFKIVSVPIRTNPATRPSRLVKSIASYVCKSAITIIRIFAVYRPFPFFASLGLVALVPGVALGIRFLYFFSQGDGQGHVQSLLLAVALVLSGIGSFMLAVMADLVSVNRRLLEDISVRLRDLEEK